MRKLFTDQQIALVLIEYKDIESMPDGTKEEVREKTRAYSHLLNKWGITRSAISRWVNKAGLSSNWKTRSNPQNDWELIKKLVNK